MTPARASHSPFRGPRLPLVAPLASGATSRSVRAKPAAQREISRHITLRLRYKTGPLVTNLSVKLRKYQLEASKVCGVWHWPNERRFTCLAAGRRLPEGTVMRWSIPGCPSDEAL